MNRGMIVYENVGELTIWSETLRTPDGDWNPIAFEKLIQEWRHREPFTDVQQLNEYGQLFRWVCEVVEDYPSKQRTEELEGTLFHDAMELKKIAASLSDEFFCLVIQVWSDCADALTNCLAQQSIEIKTEITRT